MKMSPTFLRFLVGGLTNTAVTYALFAGLCAVTNSSAAYTLTYLAGIIFSYFINTIFVFRSERSLPSALRFPLVYVVQYLYGLILLSLLTGIAQLGPRVGMLIVIVTSVPLSFVLTRYVLRPSMEDAKRA